MCTPRSLWCMVWVSLPSCVISGLVGPLSSFCLLCSCYRMVHSSVKCLRLWRYSIALVRLMKVCGIAIVLVGGSGLDVNSFVLAR